MTGPLAIPGIGLSGRAIRRGLPGDVELAFGELNGVPDLWRLYSVASD